MRCPTLLLVFLLAGSTLMAGCQGGETGQAAEAEITAEAQHSATQGGPYLLVVNKSSNTLSVVDPQTQEELKAIETGFAPHEVAVSTDRAYAYVTDYGNGAQPGNTVTVVNLESLEVERTISLAPHTRPHGIGVVSDGTFWVTTEGSAHVLHVDPGTGAILHAVETGQRTTHQLVVAEAADRVVTANIGSGNATVVNTSTGEVVAHVETGAGAEGIDVHPDGTRVYVTNREAGTVVEIDLATNQVIRTLEVGDFPIRIKVRPGGHEALVSNANGNEVVAVDLENWAVTRKLAVGAAPIGILLVPGDEMVYVANTRDDKLTIIDLVNWAVAGEVFPGDEPDGMAWTG